MHPDPFVKQSVRKLAHSASVVASVLSVHSLTLHVLVDVA